MQGLRLDCLLVHKLGGLNLTKLLGRRLRGAVLGAQLAGTVELRANLVSRGCGEATKGCRREHTLAVVVPGARLERVVVRLGLAVVGHLGTHGSPRESGARLVLLGTPAPAQAHTLAADERAVLLEGCLGTAAVRELHEAAALADRDLHVDELAVGLEVRLQVLFVNRGIEVSDEHRGVVRVRGLRDLRTLEGLLAVRGGGLGVVLAAGSRMVDSHGAARTELALHLDEGAVHLLLGEEANEAVAAGHASLAVGDHLGALDRLVPLCKSLLQNEVVHLGREVAHEEAVLGPGGVRAALVDAVGGPVEAVDLAISSGKLLAVEHLQNTLGSVVVGKLYEAVARGESCVLVPDHLHLCDFTGVSKKGMEKVLVDVGANISNPERARLRRLHADADGRHHRAGLLRHLLGHNTTCCTASAVVHLSHSRGNSANRGHARRHRDAADVPSRVAGNRRAIQSAYMGHVVLRCNTF
mmetsp:Transcript_1940/g.6969  ORF Transcript_1940/g.6969 Transcript_1940/m.6969 type:complete len:469 (+) Transcript_1940:794-2200(+)